MHERTSKWQASVFEKRKGNAYHTEAMRSVKACADQSPLGQGDSPLVKDDYRNKRYAIGGIHDRLRNAAIKQDRTTEYQLKACFIGWRWHAWNYAYER